MHYFLNKWNILKTHTHTLFTIVLQKMLLHKKNILINIMFLQNTHKHTYLNRIVREVE